MKYWVFINDDILGPLTIDEISSSSYFSKELLVCPSESSGVTPSNWYFAKELPEFEKYFDNKNKIAVEDGFDINDIIKSVSDITTNQVKNDYVENLEYEEILIEKNILKEKLDIKEKENSNYKNKISSLELKISDIQKKLDLTLEIIKDYEAKLKEKDDVILKLSKEVDDIKNKNNEDKSFKSDFKEVKETVNEKSQPVFEEKRVIETESKISDFDIKDSFVETFDKEEFVTIETPSFDSLTQTSADKVDDNIEKSIDIVVEKKDDLVKNVLPELDFNKDKSKGFESKDIKDDALVEFEKKEEANIQTVIHIDEKGEDVFDPFAGSTKNLNPTEIEQSILTKETDETVSYNNMVEMKLESSPLEKDNSIFQIADVKLEIAKSNIDVAQIKTIESLDVKSEDKNSNLTSPSVLENPVNTEINKLDNREAQEIKTEAIKIDEKRISDSNDFQTPKNEFVFQSESVKTGIENKINERVTQAKYSQRKKIKPVFKIIGIIGFVVFFAFSIIYILKSDSSTNIQNTKLASKPKFPKENISDNQVEPSTQTRINTSSDLNVSKINENVRKSIDIVKNYDLGDGKGKIQSWFSNTFSASNQVREEWNATFLSGNLFVVQYRVLRYKQEPIVYLFEVDVDKNNIVRGINNNAIDLLSGKGISKKTVAKSKANVKKINENIEKDEDMF